ncbi:MAG: nucleotidyltransferase domain-containing protein [Bacteroidetes bacterium]|nr:nucleotidyltransferase domain-containing protein [Bacteroidota bacterium]
MLNKKIAIKKVTDFVKLCQENHITFNKVILFGSVVNGRIHRYSDIDFAASYDSAPIIPIEKFIFSLGNGVILKF